MSENSDSRSTKDVATTSQTILKLPAELISMLAAELDEPDLLAMRATCRELLNASAFEFSQRYLDLVEVHGTSHGVCNLIAILTSPNLPHAQQTVKHLVVIAPRVHRLHVSGERQPNAKDVTRLLELLPNLQTTKLVDGMDASWYDPAIQSAPIFLACMAQQPPARAKTTNTLSSLDLFAVHLDASSLADMLEAHRPSLQSVAFNLVTLDDMSGWLLVLRILHSISIQSLDLAWLRCRKYKDRDRIQYLEFPQRALLNVRRRTRAVGFIAKHWVEAFGVGTKPSLEKVMRELGDKDPLRLTGLWTNRKRRYKLRR